MAVTLQELADIVMRWPTAMSDAMIVACVQRRHETGEPLTFKTRRRGGEMDNPKTNMSSPWAIYAAKTKKLFERDDEVEVELNNKTMELVLRVSNPAKAEALSALMPSRHEFGNVVLTVTVVPANQDATIEQIWRTAFDGNPVFAGIATQTVPGSTATYAMFEPDVVQFFCDDVSSVYGIATMTIEDVVRDVIGEEAGNFVCSDLLSDGDAGAAAECHACECEDA